MSPRASLAAGEMPAGSVPGGVERVQHVVHAGGRHLVRFQPRATAVRSPPKPRARSSARRLRLPARTQQHGCRTAPQLPVACIPTARRCLRLPVPPSALRAGGSVVERLPRTHRKHAPARGESDVSSTDVQPVGARAWSHAVSRPADRLRYKHDVARHLHPARTCGEQTTRGGVPRARGGSGGVTAYGETGAAGGALLVLPARFITPFMGPPRAMSVGIAD